MYRKNWSIKICPGLFKHQSWLYIFVILGEEVPQLKWWGIMRYHVYNHFWNIIFINIAKRRQVGCNVNNLRALSDVPSKKHMLWRIFPTIGQLSNSLRAPHYTKERQKKLDYKLNSSQFPEYSATVEVRNFKFTLNVSFWMDNLNNIVLEGICSIHVARL